MTQRLQGGVVNHATAPTLNAKQTVLDTCLARTADVGRKRKVPAPVAPDSEIEAAVSAIDANCAPDKTGATTPRSRENSHWATVIPMLMPGHSRSILWAMNPQGDALGSQFSPATISALYAREAAQFRARHPRSALLAARSTHWFAGTPLHWMHDWPLPFPLYVARAQGARVTDVDGHPYAAWVTPPRCLATAPQPWSRP